MTIVPFPKLIWMCSPAESTIHTWERSVCPDVCISSRLVDEDQENPRYAYNSPITFLFLLQPATPPLLLAALSCIRCSLARSLVSSKFAFVV